MPCHAMPCHAMPCHCRVKSCHVKPRHVTPCHVTNATAHTPRQHQHTHRIVSCVALGCTGLRDCTLMAVCGPRKAPSLDDYTDTRFPGTRQTTFVIINSYSIFTRPLTCSILWIIHHQHAPPNQSSLQLHTTYKYNLMTIRPHRLVVTVQSGVGRGSSKQRMACWLALQWGVGVYQRWYTYITAHFTANSQPAPALALACPPTTNQLTYQPDGYLYRRRHYIFEIKN